MEIPLNAQVECTDGIYGRSAFLLINPVVDQVTHVIVKANTSPNSEYLVPVDFIAETLADTIRLRCSKAELEKMEPFLKTKYIEEMMPESLYGYSSGLTMAGAPYYLPYVTPDIKMLVPVAEEQIPMGELIMRRGTHVEATDGYIGKVDEFVVSPENGHITHLVMREGHLWGKKDVIIPLSALKPMGVTSQDTVFLNIDKHQVEALPAFPLKRRWA